MNKKTKNGKNKEKEKIKEMKKHRAFYSASVFFNYFIINFRIIQLTTPAAQIGSNVFFKLP